MGNQLQGAKPQNCTGSEGSEGALGALPAAAKTQRVGLATSPSPSGPWTRSPAPILEPGPAGAWDDIFVTNPSAHVFPNGSALLVYKGRGSSDPNAMRTGVAWADHWAGPYERVGSGPMEGVPTSCEDAGVYKGPVTGRFIAVFHCGCNYLVTWSQDGRSWHKAFPDPLPWCSVTYADGKKGSFRRRERPQFIVDSKGELVGFSNGVLPGDGSHDGSNRVFTLVSQLA